MVKNVLKKTTIQILISLVFFGNYKQKYGWRKKVNILKVTWITLCTYFKFCRSLLLSFKCNKEHKGKLIWLKKCQ